MSGKCDTSKKRAKPTNEVNGSRDTDTYSATVYCQCHNLPLLSPTFTIVLTQTYRHMCSNTFPSTLMGRKSSA